MHHSIDLEGAELEPMARDLAAIITHALVEREAGQGPLTERLGLAGPALAKMRDKWLPGWELPDLDLPASEPLVDQDAIRTLVLWKAAATTPEAHALAAILARRAAEPRHLWEDLGLPCRPALSEMIRRELPGLARANSQNMRWKKFFYRQICSETGFQICLSPSCEECDEREECFPSTPD